MQKNKFWKFIAFGVFVLLVFSAVNLLHLCAPALVTSICRIEKR